MPVQNAAALQKDFKLGLITEATGLAYPENAVIESDNVEFDMLGRASRRLGFDFENGFQTTNIDKTLSAITNYVWKNASGNGLISFMVAQIGDHLYFYDANHDPLSGGYKASTIDMSTFEPSGGETCRITENQYTDGFGKLFVTNPNCEPFYVTYDQNTDTFSATQITVYVRDFEGVDDGLATDNRPTATVASMTKKHYYNLLNQGWAVNAQAALIAWDTARADVPSNADVWWHFKNTSDAFDTTTIVNDGTGNTQAPNGHYVLNAFNMDRNTASGLSTLTSTTSGTERPSTCAFFAGRLWYSGVNASGYNQRLFYSQVVDNVKDFGSCFQENDPTAEDFSDLLPTDGGVFDLPEAGTIYKLFPMQNALIVFGAKGIWAIRGSSGIGFLATDFTIVRVGAIRSISASSIIDVNGTPLFWNADGIWAVQAQVDQSGGSQFSVSPLSWTTIQSFYDEIPNINKPFVRGAFNPTTQIVQWLYKTSTPSTIEDCYEYDSILCFNVRSNAFYSWSIPDQGFTGGVKIHNVFVVDASGAQTVEFDVIDASTDSVIDGAGDDVVAYAQSQVSIVPTFKYFISYIGNSVRLFTVGDNQETNYKDWKSYDAVGTDQPAYFISGYKIKGGALTRVQAPYILFYNEGTGAYDVTGIWDYATTNSTGKYTSSQRLAYDDASYSSSHKKVKIRGSGRAMQYKISSVAGTGFKVIGWAEQLAVSQIP